MNSLSLDRAEPYTVEPEGRGCKLCGHSEMWDVVFMVGTPEEIALGTSFGCCEDADEMANELNAAYRNGLATAKRIVDAARAFVQTQKDESGADPDGDWLEDLKTSQSMSIPAELMALVEAVEDLPEVSL